jgi:Flp pilus assembly protein TadD
MMVMRQWQRSLTGFPLKPGLGRLRLLSAGYLILGLTFGLLGARAMGYGRPRSSLGASGIPVAAYFWAALAALSLWLAYRSLVYQRRLAAERAHRQGLTALRAARFDVARHCFQHALSLNPRLWQAQYHAGLCWQRAGRPEQARARFSAACALAPDAPGPALGLASVLDDLGELPAASSVLSALLGRYPRHPDALCLMGCLEAKLDKTESARDRFREVLALAPGHETALRNLERLEAEAHGLPGWMTSPISAASCRERGETA